VPGSSPCWTSSPATAAYRRASWSITGRNSSPAPLDLWAYRRGIELVFIRPGKPVENAYVESFHSRFRDECLSAHWFETLTEARVQIERWRQDYNEVRPHTSLAGRTPAEFAMSVKETVPITRLSA
jgi:putative transposase